MRPIQILPEVLVEVEGVTLPPEELHALAEVRVQQRLSLPTLCELTFTDPPGPLTGPSLLRPGTTLRIILGGKPEPLFAGQLTAIEHCYDPANGRAIRLRGYDSLHRLRQRQSVRAHVQVTARDLAQELVADLGLKVQATEPGPLWPRLIQHQQSDLELLQEVTERCGLYLTLRGNILHLLTLQGNGEVRPLLLGETLLEARFEINASTASQSIKATGWDPSRSETHEGQASRSQLSLAGGPRATLSQTDTGGRYELVNEAAPGDEHATRLAQAELNLRTAQELTLWGVAEGDPGLRPGTSVEVAGVADGVAGRYVLTAVTHSIDARKGYLSEISSSPPTQRTRPRGSVAAPGVVTRIDDPDRLGRVCVSLPTYGNVETDWMGVVSVGAGVGKGLMALPDVGDQVLIIFAHEDPGQGVVLGGLYGAKEPPDVGIEGGVVRRYTLLTPGGQRISLDDGQQTIRLENSQGSYCELSPQKVRLHATTELELEAPGQRIVIRAQNIDFERG